VPAYAALLRGINVGGKNKVSMPELRVVFEELGFSDVATYVQSGNVVFRTPRATAKAVEHRLEEVFGLKLAVVLRTGAQLSKVASRNPFRKSESNPKFLHVVFLDRKPPARAVERIDPERSPGDRFSLDGRELYLDYANGAGRTKLTLDYLERRLGVRGTARNWNTVLKLVELTR
jgi:uncharacterized protein (DUF1697 family)